MASTLPAQDLRVLNFVVAGEIRSGSTLVQSAIHGRLGVTCHADLFYAAEDARAADAIRRAAHEGYFGASKDPERLPEWFVAGTTNPIQYLNHTVFDHPQYHEGAVGLRLHYCTIRHWELWELFETRCREGDFCLVHVTRNPVACFVSLKQAERSGVWARSGSCAPQTCCPPPVTLDSDALTEFCRQHLAVQHKIRASCSDHLEIGYRDLFVDFQTVMRGVFEFLELPDNDEPAVAHVCRLRNRNMRGRIANFVALRRLVPSDIRNLLDAEDLF